MNSTYIIIALCLLGCLGATIPVFMSLFFTSILGFVYFTDMPILMLAQTLFRSMDNFALVVVLFFILCGNIMTAGSIVDKLIKVFPWWLGHGRSSCLWHVWGDLRFDGCNRGCDRRLYDSRPDGESVRRKIQCRDYDYGTDPRGYYPAQYFNDSLFNG